jgi:hypothetical protein
MFLLSSVSVLTLFMATTQCEAEISFYAVPATANIYSAGLSVPVAPGGDGAGLLPISVPFSAGQSSFQFSASGSITENSPYGIYHGPDGRPGIGLDVYAYGGISGFLTDQTVPLAGVFLSAAVAQDPAPSTLDFRVQGLGQDFLTLSPEIGQVFFIGDGQTTGGTTQIFYAPAGATRLYLGCPDAPFGLGYPGAYADNDGVMSVSVTAVPEPAVGTLAVAGLALSTLFRLRRKAS